MILAYAEGAWHPNGFIVVLWVLIAVGSLFSQTLIARGVQPKWLHYAAIISPLPALFILNLYVDFGRSGYNMRLGTIWAHALFYVPGSFAATITQCATFRAPTLVAVLFAHWNWLRTKLPILFWFMLIVGLIAQVASGLIFVASMDE
ncbi:MAG: hypothetical protein ABL866_09725 [Devosia sp.]